MPKCPSHICALIATYNNHATLRDVLYAVHEYVEHIIVVNDGSSDNTSNILSGIDFPIEVISYPTNRGKGYALNRGFERARELGYSHALTMDSDGQHLASEIPSLVRMSVVHPDAIIVGSRNLSDKDINGGSLFANRFSNFWFMVQTGLRLPDTQCGMRLYPLQHLHGLRILTSRYEAELELLVWAAWANVKIIPCKIDVYYPPREQRVSHFRPATDFLRISILNTIQCVLAVVYGLPRRYWRTVYFCTMLLLVVLPFIFVSLVFAALMRCGVQCHDVYHRMFQIVCRMLIHLLPWKCRISKLPKLEVGKSMVYIANHNSLLDTVALLAAHPKLLILSRRWVCNNILFGVIARTASFPNADDSVDTMLEKVRPLVAKGYSLLIFPEGSRSRDGLLGTFHAGAFYIAQRLALGIQPLRLNGFYEALSQNEFRLGPATMTIDTMPMLNAEEVATTPYRRLAQDTREKYLS
ncbi:MAG TPA: glycosyl transferase family 2 [Bacteroidales bacterium]|nr:glycosyl transferase family 2 [Bacteroidales bacterium]